MLRAAAADYEKARAYVRQAVEITQAVRYVSVDDQTKYYRQALALPLVGLLTDGAPRG